MASSAFSSQGSKYQGYPYVNPVVIDAPTIDADTAAQWTNLPRRQLVPQRKTSIPQPEIYIDLPENLGSGNSSITEGPSRLAPSVPDHSSDDEAPVVYIDLPESGSSQSTRNTSSQSTRNTTEDERHAQDFVNETILYDPFKNRRIDMSEINSDGNRNNQLTGSSSARDNSGPSFPTGLHTYPEKETTIYVPPIPQSPYNTPEARLPPPITASEFPEPPPAYSEIDRRQEEAPPRTEVIVRDSPGPVVGLPDRNNSDRKVLPCPHCNVLVRTVTLRENGIVTHIMACLFFFCFGPFTICIYWFDYFKYRNHYCPNCNEMVGYEIPLLCQGITYCKPRPRL